MNRDKKLVGIVSLGDIAVEASDTNTSGKTLKDISSPSEPNRKAA